MDTFIKYLVDNIPSLSAEDIQISVGTGIFIELKKNEVFLDYNCYANRIGIVKTGLLEMVTMINGEEKVIEFFPPQTCAADFFSFSQSKPSYTQIKALQSSEVLIFNKSDLLSLFKTKPIFNTVEKFLMGYFYSTAIERIRQMYLPPKERYELFKLNYPELAQQVSQYKIASYLNVSPEWLSKVRSNKQR